MVDGYINLANAIILQAVKDYREVLQRWKRHPEKKAYLDDKKELERFFRSDWFSTLTNIDPEVLIGNLIQEVA